MSYCTDLCECISQLYGLCCQGGLVRRRVGISVSECGPDDRTKQAMLNANVPVAALIKAGAHFCMTAWDFNVER